MSIWLGIDIGSVSLKLALLDEHGSIRFVHYARTEGAPLRALASGVTRLQAETGCDCFDRVVATGSGKNLVTPLEGVVSTNEILAHATAVSILCPGARTIIEIGGQDSKLIQLDEYGRVFDHAFNDLCAAGTGAFLDQQASRLGTDVAELGRMAARATRAVSVASRCAVFAKSDMIHHQQEGVPPGEVAAGLCLALARNYLANLLHGRRPQRPVIFCGGVARNEGVRKAFVELLQLGEGEWVWPEHHGEMGAIGAALTAGRLPAEKFRPVPAEAILRLEKQPAAETERLPALRAPVAPQHLLSGGKPAGGVFLGLDLGSVSTKGVLIDTAGQLVASHYTATEGRPLEALQRVLIDLAPAAAGKVLGCGVTGSGRMVAAAACGADVVIDEITAQLTATLLLDPETDTVFEIGGQDSKVMILRDGQLVDFALNRVCAAGTGSFLAEQGARLKVQIEGEFGSRAVGSPSPVALGSRCTVFMDSDLIHHQQRGCRTDDLLAGLAYSVAQNFLDHVVEHRRIGDRIWFQGGVAANPAVVAAFDGLLGKKIRVHPCHAVTGALGAASLARQRARPGAATRFAGFASFRPDTSTRHFTCQHCQNHCEVVQATIPGKPPLAFGGGCDRYEEEGRREEIRHHTRFVREVRELLEQEFAEQPKDLPGEGAIGLPRALWNVPLAPFWVAFFNALGRRVLVSPPSTRELYRRGLEGVVSEHCFGVKLAMGHVRSLLDAPVEFIFLPSYEGLPTASDEKIAGGRALACPYVQAVPDIARAGFPRAPLLTPRLNVGNGPRARDLRRMAGTLGPALGVSRRELSAALAAAFSAWNRHWARLRGIGRRALEETKGERRVILAGRPYQLHDPLLNFSLPVRLAAAGATVIPADILPLEDVALGEEWARLLWRAGRDVIRLTEWLDDKPGELPVVMTSFGCGPDAFVTRYLQENRRGRPLLLLELDEHTAEAGLVTRIQAYLANAPAAVPALRPAPFRPVPYARKRFEGRTIYIPYFAEQARIIKTAFLLEGKETVVLPPPDLKALEKGRAWSSGRECNPFAFMLGGLLELLERPGFDPSKARFFIPSTLGPCLLSQFPAGFEMALKGLGVEGLVIDDPTGAEIRQHWSFPTVVRLWLGMVSLEVLRQLMAEARPFEKAPGAADLAHQQNLDDLERSMLGGSLAGSLRRGRERLQAVTGPLDPDRPRVAVVGDVFTRVNPGVNADLYRRIEAQGCLVKVPPFLTDHAWHDTWESVIFHLRDGERAAALEQALVGAVQGMSGRGLQWLGGAGRGRGVRYLDWSWWAVEKKLRNKLTHDVDTTIAMNVALAIEAVRDGADAVVNAICHNCMVGMVSDTLFKRMSEEPGAPPIVTLAFDGLQATNTDTRLEAVCERAWLRKRGRRYS